MEGFTLDPTIPAKTQDIVFRFESALDKGTNCFHLNYDSGRYREDELVKLIRDAIPSFALTHDEYEQYMKERAISEANSRAVNRISKAHKYAKGDYGELLLFLILEAFENAPKFVTKVKLRSSKGDQVKGYDCAHFTVSDSDQVTLWLGEAKFHQNVRSGVADAIKSLKEHTEGAYLRDELDLLYDNVEKNSNISQHYYDVLMPFLRKTRSLDDVTINIPVLLTYDSNAISKSISHTSKDFSKLLEAELLNISSTHLKGKEWPQHQSTNIIFYVFPLKSVATIKQKLKDIEDALR